MIKRLIQAIDGERDGKLIRLENKNNIRERKYLKGVKKKVESFGYEIPVVLQNLINKKIYYIVVEKMEKQNA